MLGVLPRLPARGPAGAGLIAGGVVMVLPAALVELAVSAVGLTELLPGLAPPISILARLWLATVIGVEVAAVAMALTGGRSVYKKEATQVSWPRSFGLRALTRLARGRDAEAIAPDAPMTTPLFGAEAGQQAIDERRRVDLHPDAPPRAPLLASRDLPPLSLVPVVEPEPEPSGRFATAIRETSAAERDRPLPRAPEPLSDTDVEQLRAPVVQQAPSPAPASPSIAVMPAVTEGTPLADLLARFEAGVDQRLAATGRVVVDEPAPEADMALREALDTLRQLSAETRKAG